MKYKHLIPKLKEYMNNSRKDIEIGCTIDQDTSGALYLSNYNMGKANSVRLPPNNNTIGYFHTHTDSYITNSPMDRLSSGDIQHMIRGDLKIEFLGYQGQLMVCEIFKFPKTFSRLGNDIKSKSGREWRKALIKMQMFLHDRLKII